MCRNADARERVALYFGSFNPPHNGHLAIGCRVVEGGWCDRVVYVVSPQNPFKKADELAPASERLAMTRLAVGECGMEKFAEVSDIEMSMPRPSYTFDTLLKLKEQNERADYYLIMGGDNVADFDKWHRAAELEKILSGILVYPRKGYDVDEQRFTLLTGVPFFDFSSTMIREKIARKESVAEFLPRSVEDYIRKKGIYGIEL